MVHQSRCEPCRFRRRNWPDGDRRDCESYRWFEVWIPFKDYVSERESDRPGGRSEGGDTSMKPRLGIRILVLAVAILLPLALAYSQEKASSASAVKAKVPVAANKIRRTADGHPDLSGLWTFGIDL